jgi:hypothetical protein
MNKNKEVNTFGPTTFCPTNTNPESALLLSQQLVSTADPNPLQD